MGLALEAWCLCRRPPDLPACRRVLPTHPTTPPTRNAMMTGSPQVPPRACRCCAAMVPPVRSLAVRGNRPAQPFGCLLGAAGACCHALLAVTLIHRWRHRCIGGEVHGL